MPALWLPNQWGAQTRRLLVKWASRIDSEWQDFTPTLTASSTNPTLGSGGVAEGRYKLGLGGTVHYRFRIQFGSSGADGGSGEYRVSLPVPMSSEFPASTTFALGSAVLFDWSVAGHKELAVPARSSISTAIRFYVKDGTVWHNNPFTWTNDDRFGGSLTYEAER